MTKRTLMSLAAVVALLVLLPGAAQLQNQAASKRACHPEGTWFGSNTDLYTFVIRVTPLSGGRYSAVADGWNTIDPIALEKTAWHGELVRTGPRSFWLRQIAIFELNPALFPTPFPPLVLVGTEGEVTMTGSSCDHINMVFENTGAYFWDIDLDFERPVPFVDEFDFPVPPGVASYDRMPEY